MPSINEIPIKVQSPAQMLSGQAEAVLSEIAELLGRLVQSGEAGSIDLRSLPLTPADRVWLDEQLGRGEVEIVLNAGGKSELSETAYAGVWRVVHRDLDERVIAELIEVAFVPEIVKPAAADIAAAYDRLRSDLNLFA